MFGIELMACPDLAVPREVMQHVVRVESSFNPYAIGVVGGRLVRQPRTLPEAVATARMLERRGYNFSLGLAQVNRYNLAKQGLRTYRQAFQTCPNLQAGSRILAECHGRSGGDWGRAFSCYYSGNFVTGYRHGYVQKVFASMRQVPRGPATDEAVAIEVVGRPLRRASASAVRAARAVAIAAPERAADRIAARTAPIEPRTPAPPAPAAAASVAPAAADIAVLDPRGGPPRLVGAATGTSGTAVAHGTADALPAAAPRLVDTAFVF